MYVNNCEIMLFVYFNQFHNKKKKIEQYIYREICW